MKSLSCLLATLAFLLALLAVAISHAVAQDSASDSALADRNRLVRVVTVSQEGLSDVAGGAMVEATLARMDGAAAFRPDIVCLPEAFTRGEPETVPGPTTERLAAWARKNNCYVLCPIHVRSGEQIFNSAVLIDRKGEVVGRYDKIRPTEGELERSICPGNVDPPTFETDFGTIGVQICFDVNWHSQWRRLKEKGATIIFFPSAYPAARQLTTLAWLNQCFVVSATRTRASTVFDITGEPIETTGKYRQWAGAVLPLGKRLFEIDYHTAKMREIERKYGSKVRITWYHDDDLVTLASVDPDLTVDDLIGEFDLTPHAAYLQRAQQSQDAQRRLAEAAVQSQR